MIRVLLVEDDPVIRDTTCYFLKSQQNFEVVCAETGGDALSHAREKFDVILMDILLPDTNGVDLCQRLRSWHHCPIIFTSCLDDTDTIVRALEMGGDDFLAKPYNNKILLARIMANIRRVQMDGAEPSVNGYHCAAFTLDANSHSVEKDGRSVHLADMEYRILTLFIRYPNTFFTANELYQKIWGKESLGDVRTVQVHIHNLRSKIEPDPAKPVYLKNVWGRFMSLITVCACLTQPVGQATFGLLYGRFAALPSAVLFAAAAVSIFINIAASHIFKKAASFTKS